MRKVFGLTGLLAALVAVIFLIEQAREGHSTFLTAANLRNLLLWIGLYGILSLGQCVVIITGGIDLSAGSVVGLTAVSSALLLNTYPAYAVPCLLFVLLVAAGIGAVHGLLITKGRMQPFVVTLCGLFFYRGIARVIADDRTQGFGLKFGGLKWYAQGYAPREDSVIPVVFILFLALAGGLWAYLHQSRQGRHIFALGANEEAARFSGVNTDRLKILAYTLCALFGGLAGILFAFKVNSLQPSDFGSFYELYAIAGVVLGGCSLRGGSGNVLGVVIGAALIQALENMVNILAIPSQLKYVAIGGAILIGVLLDEIFSRRRGRGAG